MTYGDLRRLLADQFDDSKPARLRISFQLAEMAAEEPTMLAEVVEVKQDWENPDLMMLTFTDVRAIDDGR